MAFKMSDDDLSHDRTGAGGGFDISGYGSPGDSLNEGSGKPSRGPSSLYPVTIKQILTSPEDGLRINGNLVTMITIVGIVKSIEITATKILYTVDDWSGSILAIQWIEAEDDGVKSPVVEDTYCRMSGTKKIQEGNPIFFIYNIVPIENMMEITNHFLEVIYIPIKSEHMDKIKDVPKSFMKVQMSASYGDTKGAPYTCLNLGTQQTRVYRVLQQCNNEEGLDNKGIQSMLNVKVPLSEIDNALEYLVSEGHVYATIDDYHFKATDLAS